MINILVTLCCGAIAGWIAGIIMGTNGSLLRNLILGVLGGVVGSVVLGIIGIGATSTIGGIIVAVIGACLLVWLGRKFLK